MRGEFDSLYPHHNIRYNTFQMHNPKKYTHDRLILLLLSISAFLVIFGSLQVALRLGGRNSSYIVEYRANLGVSHFKPGTAWGLVNFIAFMLIITVVNILISIRVYQVRREYAATVLGLGVLLLVITIVVSNALLIT